jgi:hypothetical protein
MRIKIKKKPLPQVLMKPMFRLINGVDEGLEVLCLSFYQDLNIETEIVLYTQNLVTLGEGIKNHLPPKTKTCKKSFKNLTLIRTKSKYASAKPKRNKSF